MRRARTNVSNDMHHIQSSLPPCICAVSFTPATVVKSRSPIRPSSSKMRSRFGSTAGSAPSARGSIDRSMARYRPATSGFRPSRSQGDKKVSPVMAGRTMLIVKRADTFGVWATSVAPS